MQTYIFMRLLWNTCKPQTAGVHAFCIHPTVFCQRVRKSSALFFPVFKSLTSIFQLTVIFAISVQVYQIFIWLLNSFFFLLQSSSDPLLASLLSPSLPFQSYPVRLAFSKGRDGECGGEFSPLQLSLTINSCVSGDYMYSNKIYAKL